MKKQLYKKTREEKEKKRRTFFPLTADNYRLLGLGVLIIVFGYIALRQGPADSIWSLTIAPILLVIGYCVVIPFAIMYQKKKSSGD